MYLSENELKSFNCSPPVLFLCLFLLLADSSPPVPFLYSFVSFAMSINWFTRFCSAINNQIHLPTMLLLYWFLADWNLHMREDAVLTNCTPKNAHASVFFCTSGILHARYIRAIFELQGRPFCSSFLVSFFLSFFRCCYERNSIHTASLSHFIFCSLGSPPVLFLSSRVRLLNSRKRQHATRGLFERWIPVGLSETAVCGFCLSISLHEHNRVSEIWTRLLRYHSPAG